jgi:hypothetical protein
MRYLLVLCISTVIIGSANAQCEFPLHTGDLWQLIDNFPMVHIVHDVHITGLTEKGGHVYSAFSGFVFLPGPGYLRQSGAVVYAFGDSSEYVFYNFAAAAGDTISIRPSFVIVLDAKDSTDFFGTMRKRWIFREISQAPFNYIVRHVIDSIGMSYLYQGTGGQTYYLAGALIDGMQYGKITDVGAGPKDPPTVFWLAQNFPNPFNPTTTIRYGLPNRSHVSLTVLNTLGQSVSTLINGEQEVGYHEVQFNATHLSSGVYFYRIQAEGYVQTKSLLLLR